MASELPSWAKSYTPSTMEPEPALLRLSRDVALNQLDVARKERDEAREAIAFVRERLTEECRARKAAEAEVDRLRQHIAKHSACGAADVAASVTVASVTVKPGETVYVRSDDPSSRRVEVRADPEAAAFDREASAFRAEIERRRGERAAVLENLAAGTAHNRRELGAAMAKYTELEPRPGRVAMARAWLNGDVHLVSVVLFVVIGVVGCGGAILRRLPDLIAALGGPR